MQRVNNIPQQYIDSIEDQMRERTATKSKHYIREDDARSNWLKAENFSQSEKIRREIISGGHLDNINKLDEQRYFDKYIKIRTQGPLMKENKKPKFVMKKSQIKM